MKVRLSASIVFILVGVSLGGCLTTQNGGTAPQPVAATQTAIPPITVSVPNDPAIVQSVGNTPYALLAFSNNNPPCDKFANNGRIFRLYVENKTGTSFVVHSRIDNCIAGSGVKYQVNYTISRNDQGLTLGLQPVGRSTYQEGLVMPMPIPSFGDRDLLDFLEQPVVAYQFEVNSNFNKDSVFANFTRLSRRVTEKDGSLPDVKHKDWFSIQVNNRPVKFSVEVYPYRDGSKAVIYARVPGIETSPNTVDFREIFNLLKTRIEEIVNS